jgi:hypothetical protein
MLNQLVAQITGRLAPIFTRLLSLAQIDIGPNFTKLEDVEVDVTAIGISNATAFIGLPPEGGLNFDTPIADQDAIGLFVQNLNMGLGIFKPVAGGQLPNFTALKLSADSAGFADGGQTFSNSLRSHQCPAQPRWSDHPRRECALR